MVTESISQKILCVDDEPRLLAALQRQLRKEFTVFTAESAKEGLELIAKEGPFALVISDYKMPVMNGIDFLQQVHKLNGDTILAMLSGQADLEIAVEALNRASISRFLSKPCPKQILLQTIRDALEQYRLVINEKFLRIELEQSNSRLNELNQRLEELVSERTQTLRMQYQYVNALTIQDSSSQIADLLIGTVKYLTQTDQVLLYLSQKNNPEILINHEQSSVPDIEIANLQNCLLNPSIKQKLILDLSDIQALSAQERACFLGEPLAVIPIETKDQVIGLITIGGKKGAFIDMTLLSSINTLANTTATALINRLHLEVQNEAQDALISSLAKLAEFKDPETGAHLLRLKKYCELLCIELGKLERYQHIISEQFTQDIVRSSPLHDIGKVGIPDAILTKPGKLTVEEFEIMKNHTRIGGDILKSVYDRYKSQTFIQSGMEMAHYHHEKWDGSGYPESLKGSKIPISARILAVADVYDALTSKRVYKSPFSREQSKAIILDGNGKHFDPDVVSAFIKLENQFYEIAQQYADAIT